MSRFLIAGCGFLGEAAAFQLLSAGCEIVAMVASSESAARLSAKGLPCHIADLSSGGSVSEFARRAGKFDGWVHCASSGGGGEDAYRAIYLDGTRNLLAAFPASRPVLVGSTSVYAQTGGEWVDECSPAQPTRPTGRILLEAERLALDAGGTVLRLAGIYGPGRSVLLKKFLSGQARIEGDGARWINQIHRDDGAAALRCIVGHTNASGIFNVADLQPWRQSDFYRRLAQELELPLPPTAPPDFNRKRGWSNKRVCSAKLRRLGWAPRFPDYFSALPDLLVAQAAPEPNTPGWPSPI